MTAEISAVGVAPLDRTSSGEIKPVHIYSKNFIELQDHDPLAKTDKIQLSVQIESSQTFMPYHLTTDKYLNEYIHMIEQAAKEDIKVAGTIKADENSESVKDNPRIGRFDLQA